MFHKTNQILENPLKLKKNPKGSLFKKKIVNFAHQYCSNTSLHGFHYIFEGNGHTPIRSSLWTIVCLTCIAFCCYLIYIQLIRFTTNVTNTSITSTGYPVWENPFPGVTICNNYLVYKKNTEKIKGLLVAQNYSEGQVDQFFEQLSQLLLCANCKSYNDTDDTSRKILGFLEGVGYDVNKIMREVTASCSTILRRCFWKSKEYNCSSMFRMVKTTNGFCCSFNYYGSKHVQNMTTDEDNIRYYTGGSGIPFGLKIELFLDKSQYKTNIKINDGFEVLVRDGYDYPDMKMYANSLLVGDMLTIGLSPQVLKSDPEVKDVYEPIRGCWFTDEGNLESSYIYSFSSCLVECMARTINEFCKCVPYFYPLSNLTGVKTCTFSDTKCLEENELKFNSLVLTTSLTEATMNKIKKRVGEAIKCRCLPTCDEVRYDSFIEKTHTFEYEKENMSVLNVYFNSIACTKRTRNVIVTWDMLLASIGGIFGLCLGGSVLSLIELVYHVIDTFFDDNKVDVSKNPEKEWKVEKLDFESVLGTYPLKNQIVFPHGDGFPRGFKGGYPVKGEVFKTKLSQAHLNEEVKFILPFRH